MNENVTQDESTDDVPKVTATRVEESARINCLPNHFGRSMLKVEHTVYHFMNKLVRSYNGAYWEFYELSNGGFYMAPRIDSPVELFVEGNGYSGRVSADAAGIIACLFTFSHLSFKHPEDERIAKHFHLLREFADHHAEGSAIFAACD